MARSFSGTAQYLSRGSAVLTAAPVTMACWAKMNNFTGTPFLGTLGQSGNTDRFEFFFETTGAASAQCVQASSGTKATTTSTASTGAWTHVAAVFASSTSRSIYMNGGNKVTDTTSKTPSGINNTWLAASGGSSPTHLVNGTLAFFAFWNVALSDADVLSLYNGASPRLVRPDKLVSYARLTGGQSPEPDMYSSTRWTLTGSPTEVANPLIFVP